LKRDGLGHLCASRREQIHPPSPIADDEQTIEQRNSAHTDTAGVASQGITSGVEDNDVGAAVHQQLAVFESRHGAYLGLAGELDC